MGLTKVIGNGWPRSTTTIESLQGNNHLMHVYTGIVGTVQPGLLGLCRFQDMDLELL